MSQVFQFGRAGLATAQGGDGLQLECSSWEQEGERAKVEMVVRAQSSDEDSKALAGQVNGYGPENPDEPVIPVTWTRDSSIDGYYRVLSTGIAPEVTGRRGSSSEAGTNTAYILKADLLRVPGATSPLIELLSSGADRANTSSVTNGDSWAAIPNGADGPVQTVNSSSSYTLATEDSVDALVYSDATELYDDSIIYHYAPGPYYNSSSRIEFSRDNGTTYRQIVGRQFPYALGVSNIHWRISNGALRVGSTNASTFTVGIYDSTWESKTYKLTSDSSASALTPVAAEIIRNSPECCTIRLVYTGAASFGTYADFTVKRGSWVVEIYLSHGSTATTTQQLGIFRTAVEAGTDITGGLEATADDADGNKYRLYSAQTVTTDNTNGGIHLTSAGRSISLGVSTDALSLNAGAITSHDMYFAAMNHRQRVFAR